MEDAEVAGFLFSSFLMWNINTKMKSDPGIGMTNLPLRASTTNVCICGGAVKGRRQSLQIAAFTPVPDGTPKIIAYSGISLFMKIVAFGCKKKKKRSVV